MKCKAFILTDGWFDSGSRNVIVLYGISGEAGPVKLLISNTKPVFFIEETVDISFLPVKYKRKKVGFKSIDGKTLDALYFETMRDFRRAEEEIASRKYMTYESDIDPARRFLMEKSIYAQVEIEGEAVQSGQLTIFRNPKLTPVDYTPHFSSLSLDIETGQDGSLYSVALHYCKDKEEKKHVLTVGTGDGNEWLEYMPGEKELLAELLRLIKLYDPDFIIGWHIIGFDLMFLERKFVQHNVPFEIGRDKGRVSLRVKGSRYFASVPGRIVIDGPVALRSSFYSFDDFTLETVSQELLGKGKTITAEQQDKVAEIEHLFRNDKEKLAEYNLNDTVLVSEIFQKTGLIELMIKRAQISGLLIERLGMMTHAFDHFYLPKFHKAGYAAPNVKDLNPSEHAAGGYVIEPLPGIYDDVVVLDFRSLYPSIILTFKIDPYSRIMSNVDTVDTPAGIEFSATQHLLPLYVKELLEKRSEAKKKRDKYLSQAIKILMNSFYGVMGSYGCRFYHPDLPTAITGSGQKLLLGSKKFFEDKGYKVIYGDTDSLFVKLKEEDTTAPVEAGERIAAELNLYWQVRLKELYNVDSYLEIEYEKHYKKFVITQSRGGELGAKKRYAGWIKDSKEDRIEFTGMEMVRSDWTRLAKNFQQQLYQRIFNGEDIERWIKNYTADIYAGKYNGELIYRKRLRKNIEHYIKNIPPQVKAARLVNVQRGEIKYIYTLRGPIPLELEHNDIDYKHYIEKQIKPIADSLLLLLGISFDSLVSSTQLSFFD